MARKTPKLARSELELVTSLLIKKLSHSQSSYSTYSLYLRDPGARETRFLIARWASQLYKLQEPPIESYSLKKQCHCHEHFEARTLTTHCWEWAWFVLNQPTTWEALSLELERQPLLGLELFGLLLMPFPSPVRPGKDSDQSLGNQLLPNFLKGLAWLVLWVKEYSELPG